MIDLKVVIQDYPNSLKNRIQLAAILHDLYPTEKREVNLALAVYDCGIVNRISKMKTLELSQKRVFIKLLEDEWGIREDYALLAVKLWAMAFNVEIETEQSIFRNEMHNKPVSKPNLPSIDVTKYADTSKTTVGTSSDFEINVINGDNAVITKFLGFDETHMIVPNIVDGYTVIGVGKDAYKGCKTLERLIISNGIEYIDDGAFACCENLKSVSFSQTIKRIGSIEQKSDPLFQLHNNEDKGAFSKSGLSEIFLPLHLTSLGDYTFSNCKNLKKVHFPNNLVHIGNYTFCYCEQLDEIVFPLELKKIGDFAFLSCAKLRKVVFNPTLEEIGDRTFYDCKSIESIALNEGLHLIGQRAFGNCANLKRCLLPSTLIEGTFDNDFFIINRWHQPADGRRKGWFYDSINKNLTLYCYPGTYALQFARKNGYPIKKAEEFTE